MEQEQQAGNIYRGIKLADSVKLYKKNGSYADKVKLGLDKFVDLLEENGNKILSIYINSQTKILVDFNCGHEPHWIKPNHYMRGIGCPKCRGEHLSEKFTSRGREAFQLLVRNNGHELLSDYIDSYNKVLIDFKCGHEPHWIKPPDYKNEHGCMECGRERTNLSLKEKSNKAKSELETILKENGHEWLGGEYRGGHEKILIDLKCGHPPYWISPSEYKSGSRCRRCVGTSSEQSKEDLMKVVQERGHVLLSEYTNSKSKVLIDFNCGHEPYWIGQGNYKRGFGCPRCSGKSLEQAKEKLIELVNRKEHILLSDYINSGTKVLIDFKCGHEPHWITPSDYKSGYGCPICTESKGERIIREYLEREGITFIQEYKFPNSKKRYDFMLPFKNVIVEVHGKQHYTHVSFFNEVKSKRRMRTLKQEQDNDRKKQEFAERLGYYYIVVDYREGKPQLALERFIEIYNKLISESE